MPDLLRKIAFTEQLLPAVQAFDCGGEEWETPLNLWIKAQPNVRNGALFEIEKAEKKGKKLDVWLHVSQAGELVGYSSLAESNWRWPLPDDERVTITNEWEVSFSREIMTGDGANAKTETVDDIKVSRGEENIFIWCFFLAIVQLVLAKEEAYKWVKYIYIDDPISSLDEHNAIVVANHLAQLLLKPKDPPKTVISSHHTLFFNVLGNEFQKKARRYFLSKGPAGYLLRNTSNTPFFHHVASLRELCQAAESGELRTHHFNVLRSLMEKTASFHGYHGFAECIQPAEDDPDKTLYTRVINIISHGNYSLYEPVEMMHENKEIFRKLLNDFRASFPFNPKLFGEQPNEADTE